MGRALIEAHPWIAPYVKISCEKTHGALDGYLANDKLRPANIELPIGDGAWAHHCTFQGWEEVTEQCDFPYARETNRQFRSDKHRIEKS